MTSKIWKSIPCLANQLQLKTTLLGGQSFRWKLRNEDEFIGVFANILWILKQDDKNLMYKILGELPYPSLSEADKEEPLNKKQKMTQNLLKVRMKVDEPVRNKKNGSNQLYVDRYYEDLLRIYFRLDINLEELYIGWAKAHSHFEDNADKFYAVRQLNQSPEENLVSFICSQNNNISRISGLVEKICINYGTKICDFEGVSYYNFPEMSSLSDAKVEGHLRQLSFGYRAKYIQKSAQEIVEKGGLEWFKKLTEMDYKEAHKELLTLTGIGPKVADCICLMSLDHLQAIPVDTHVFQIAKHYLPHLSKSKNITGKMYTDIGDKFREIYGSYAGWAQTVLFCADLRQFKENKDKV